jgi:hypothetical protein
MVYIAFRSTTLNQWQLYLDDISVGASVQAPDCASNYLPIDGDTDVAAIGDVIFSWDAPTTGGAVVSYNVYGGTDPGALALLGNTTDLTFNVGSIEEYGFIGYWQVVPVNAGGEAVGCPINSFTTVSSPGFCLNAQYGQYPAATYTPATCDGTTVNNIVTDAYAGEYSSVNVTSGVSYTFSSSVATDFITISSDDGATAAAYGVTPLTWVADVTGEVRFYTHLDDQCGSEDTNRTRSIVCTSSLALPDCAINLTPADGSTTVPAFSDVIFTWEAPTTGGPVASYNVYGGTDPGDLVLFDNVTDLTYNAGTIGAYNFIGYWQIVPVNVTGEAVGCSVLSFTTEPSPGYCLNNVYDPWPIDTYIPEMCDGLTDNVIATNCYAGEYSVVTVVSGETYTFKSSVATDLITISTDDGVTAAAYGVTPLTWVSDFSGDIRFYTHLDDQCGEEAVNRTRSIVCGAPSVDSPDYVSLQWPPTMSISQGGSDTVYAQVYEAGLTDTTTGQAPGINAWVGVSTTNTNPNTWTNWTVATYDSEQNNNDQYSVNIGAALAPGTYYYATRFNLNGGAYVYGGINQSAPNNGNFWDGTTFVNGILTVTPPPAPANDECTGAISINLDEATCDGVNTNGTTFGATDSGLGLASCFFGDDGVGDVWFSFIAPDDVATVDISTDFLGGTSYDTEIALYSGVCGTLAEIACDADSGTVVQPNGFSWNSLISDTAVDAGATYYVRVSAYGADNVGTFCLKVSRNQLLDNISFDSSNFTYYPNPVKNVLNLSYSQNISQVEVYNLLGQKMNSNSFNATTAQVDMSNLASGAYLVRVTSNNTTKTVRVIKE